MLPNKPNEGPPVPSNLNISWPWYKRKPNNQSYIAKHIKIREINSDLANIANAKKSDLISKGISPVLAEKAIDWAEGYTKGLVKLTGGGISNEELSIIYRVFPSSLEMCEQWVKQWVKGITT